MLLSVLNGTPQILRVQKSYYKTWLIISNTKLGLSPKIGSKLKNTITLQQFNIFYCKSFHYGLFTGSEAGSWPVDQIRSSNRFLENIPKKKITKKTTLITTNNEVRLVMDGCRYAREKSYR